MDERRFRAKLAGAFDEIECPDRIDVEIIEGNAGSQIVRRLGGGVDDDGRLKGLDQTKDTGSISNVQFMVTEAREVANEPLLVPAGVALRAEKRFALIVVDAMDGEPVFMKKLRHFRADETGRACDQTDFAHALRGTDLRHFGFNPSPDKGVIKRNSGAIRKQHLKR